MTMPFGKYEGYSLHELPNDYLLWLASIELRGRLKEAVTEEIRYRSRTNGYEPPARRRASSVTLCFPEADIPLLAEIIDRGYRAVAFDHHPDRGGDGETMRQLNLLAESIREQIAQVPA